MAEIKAGYLTKCGECTVIIVILAWQLFATRRSIECGRQILIARVYSLVVTINQLVDTQKRCL